VPSALLGLAAQKIGCVYPDRISRLPRRQQQSTERVFDRSRHWVLEGERISTQISGAGESGWLGAPDNSWSRLGLIQIASATRIPSGVRMDCSGYAPSPGRRASKSAVMRNPYLRWRASGGGQYRKSPKASISIRSGGVSSSGSARKSFQRCRKSSA
jgi:hypothetical protein